MIETITRGTVQRAQRIVIYGPEGIGKSTFASRFPTPVFIDTEGSTDRLDVPRFPRPQNFDQVIACAKSVLTGGHGYKTLVIDTADWAEKLAAEQVCAKSGKSGIEDFGYGKGYVWLGELFAQLLKVLDLVRDRGIHAAFVAHAQIRKFEQPDEAGAYDRYELKCTRVVSPLLKEWSDMLLFANYKTIVEEGQNGKARARGGKRRVMYANRCAAWDAKNRHSLPDELPFEFEAIAAAIDPARPARPANPAKPPNPVSSASPASPAEPAVPAQPAQPAEPTQPAQPAPSNQNAGQEPAAFHAALYTLMDLSGVTEGELHAYLVMKTFITPDQTLHNLPEKFVAKMIQDENCEKVTATIREMRQIHSSPLAR